MTEIPGGLERKVLKEILLKLKVNAISSWELLERAFLSRKKLFDGVLKQAEEFSEKKRDAISQRWLNAIDILNGEFHRLVKDAAKCIEDLNLYIESLEKYSSELDKTLWDIIKQAEKTAEEEIKKKEKLLKKSPQTYRI